MRTAIVIVLAATLAATPAMAQNDTNAAVDANATTEAIPADNGELAANDVSAVPVEPMTVENTEPAPAPEPERRSGGFPWGVVGLVGLVGLMGHKRRD